MGQGCQTPMRGLGRALVSPRRRSSRGQALAVLLPLLVVLSAALIYVFDSGQAVAEKQRLVNAADAAALSAATWQARTLNFESYMSRAVIANEAAIAQSVSLRSWSAYMARLLPDAAAVTRFIPLLNAATLALERFWVAFDQTLQPGLSSLEGLLGLVDHDLAAAQRLADLFALEAVPEAVRATLAANDPRYRVSPGGELLLARWMAEWIRFTSLYGGAFRWRQGDLLNRSLDGFTTARGVTLSPLLVGALVRFEKRGGTELIDFETWRGLDTFSLHTVGLSLTGRRSERLPLAWGGAEAGRFAPRRGSYGGSTRTNPRATRLAYLFTRRSQAYRGLPSLRDLSVAQRERLAVPQLVVRATLSAEELSLARRSLSIASLVDLRGREYQTDAPQSTPALFAVAAAEARFVRTEARADGARELPSLFSPYWRARLMPVPRVEAALAAAADNAFEPALELLR